MAFRRNASIAVWRVSKESSPSQALQASAGIHSSTRRFSEDAATISPRTFLRTPAVVPPSSKERELSASCLGIPLQLMAASSRSKRPQ